MSDQNKPYFAPPATEPMPEGENPAWGADAEDIARGAGLGSYGGAAEEQLAREDAMLGALERANRAERERWLGLVMVLWCVALTAAVVWLALRK